MVHGTCIKPDWRLAGRDLVLRVRRVLQAAVGGIRVDEGYHLSLVVTREVRGRTRGPIRGNRHGQMGSEGHPFHRGDSLRPRIRAHVLHQGLYDMYDLLGHRQHRF